MKFWVILGDTETIIFPQDTVPEVSVIGKKSPPFPVYIQCNSLNDAKAVAGVQQELENLRSYRLTPTRLASLLYASPHLPKIMTETIPCFAILNGRSFKGILISNDDRKAQLDGHQWASAYPAYNLRDALLLIILGGDKNAFEEIANVNLSDCVDRLTMTALSYHSDGMRDRARFCPNSPESLYSSIASSSTSSTSTIRSPPVSTRGRSRTSSVTTSGQGSSTAARHPTRRPPSGTTTRHHPISPTPPIQRPTAVYKYIRGVVGSITDPSGMDPTVHSNAVCRAYRLDLPIRKNSLPRLPTRFPTFGSLLSLPAAFSTSDLVYIASERCFRPRVPIPSLDLTSRLRPDDRPPVIDSLLVIACPVPSLS